MNKRIIINHILVIAAAYLLIQSVGLAAKCACKRTTGPSTKPNILFIFSDDHAQSTISAYDGILSSIHQTPNIDRIADEGAIFRNSFCGNSICQPSRATVMTGKHSHKNGVLGNGVPWDARQMRFPRLLEHRGYETALFGKWHLDPDPLEDEFGKWEVLSGAGGQGYYYNPTFNTANGSHSVEGYSTDIVTDKAINWLESAWDPNNPFLLFVQFKSTHVPRHPPINHIQTYETVTIPEPPTLFDDYAGRLYAANACMGIRTAADISNRTHIFRPLGSSEPQETWAIDWFARLTSDQIAAMHTGFDVMNADFYQRQAAGEFDTPEKYKAYNYQRRMKNYLACVLGIDDNVGRLLDWLDTQSLAENTLVVYASDQSYYVGEHGWMEKRWMFEESFRMPLVMRWPQKVAPGTEITEFVQNIDYAPTFLEMAGVDIPSDMQGRSLLPLLTGQTPNPAWRDTLYYHYYDHGRHCVPRHDGVRTDRYKLICYYTDDAYELFDLQTDPYELTSVYGDSAYTTVQQDMLNRLTQLRQEYEVPADHFVAPYPR